MRTFQICLLITLMLNGTASHAAVVVQNEAERIEASFDSQDAGFLFSPVAGPAGSLIDVSNDACCALDTFRLDISILLDGMNVDDFIFVEAVLAPGATVEFSQADFTLGLGGSLLGLEETALRITRPVGGGGWQASLVMTQSGCTVLGDFAAGTLTVNFDLAPDVPVNWNFGIFVLNFYVPVWSIPLGVIDPVASFPIPFPAFPSLGTIVVVSSFTTPTDVVCFDFDLVDTSP